MDNKEEIEVETGQVKVAKSPVHLSCSALGSCVALVIYDAEHQIGGIAHIMLPSSDMCVERENPFKCVEFAIENLIKKLLDLGANKKLLGAKLVGGSSIVKDSADIGAQNIQAVKEKLIQEGIKINAQRVGGVKRRSLILDLSNGVICYNEGGGKEMKM